MRVSLPLNQIIITNPRQKSKISLNLEDSFNFYPLDDELSMLQSKVQPLPKWHIRQPALRFQLKLTKQKIIQQASKFGETDQQLFP